MVSAFTRELFNRLQAARPKHRVQPLHDEGVHFHPFRERQFAQLVVNGWRQIDGLLNGRVFRRATATGRDWKPRQELSARPAQALSSVPARASRSPDKQFYAALTCCFTFG